MKIIRNLHKPLNGEDEYYKGPTLREAKLSMAVDIVLLCDEQFSVEMVFKDLRHGIDYADVSDSEACCE